MPELSKIEAIQRIRNEIETLKREQNEALEKAIYVGWSCKESQHDDERRDRIKTLVEQLARKQNSD
jgi:hypothetical protein